MWTSSKGLDAAFRFATHLFLDYIASAVSNQTVYVMRKDWTRFPKYAMQANKSQTVFQALPSSVATELCVICPSSPTKIVIHVESVDPEMSSTDVMVAEA